MQCPVDQSTLQMTERNGVEIDYCPKCRGVWLDRGELDKILERASQEYPTARGPPVPVEGHDPRYPDKRKKRGFLHDLFD